MVALSAIHCNFPRIDINECDIGEPCEQVCVNNVGSFECRCVNGYQLEVNGLNCSGNRIKKHFPLLLL